MPKKKETKKNENQLECYNFETQKMSLEDFGRMLKVVENSEMLFLKFEGNDVCVDYSKIDKKNLKILSKKGDVIKSINYKQNYIEIVGNKFDCLELYSQKKNYYLPITKKDGSVVVLTGGR